ncbi:MAG: hypothetical protein ABIK92_12385 [Pseudomonadota bacterium]
MKSYFLFIVLIFLPVNILAGENIVSCASNAYIVESKKCTEGLDFKGAKSFDLLPLWVPEFAVEKYAKAQSLPINAKEDEIKNLFKTKAEVQGIGKSFQKFNWLFREDNREYNVLVKRTYGCVSEINLFIAKNNKGEKYLFSQVNATPTGSTCLKIFLPEDGCQIRRTKKQKYEYTIDGMESNGNDRDIPKYASMLFVLFDSFNFKKQRILNKIGDPVNANDDLIWKLKDKNGLNYHVALTTLENCAKLLTISWKDNIGKQHILTKENYYK